MQRILVMGSSGSGKSTFAQRTFREQQRPKLLAYFAGLRPDQSLICFTDRGQVDCYLNELTLLPNLAGVH